MNTTTATETQVHPALLIRLGRYAGTRTSAGGYFELLTGDTLIVLAPMTSDGLDEQVQLHAARRMIRTGAKQVEIWSQRRDGQGSTCQVRSDAIKAAQRDAAYPPGGYC